MIYNSSSDADKIAADLATTYKVKVKSFQCDIANIPLFKTTIDTIEKDFGLIDVLVLNAGNNVRKPAEDMTEEDFDSISNVNYKSVFFGMQHLLKIWTGAQRKGNIIVISSVLGESLGLPVANHVYGGCKAAINLLVKNFAYQYASKNIRINTVSPGWVETPMTAVRDDGMGPIWQWFLQCQTDMTPQKRMAKVEEIENLLLFLASDVASFVTGSNYTIDGGYSLSQYIPPQLPGQ